MKKILIPSLLSSILMLQEGNAGSVSSSTNPYKEVSFEHLVKQTNGLNPELMQMHLDLYKGYVKNSNLIRSELAQLSKEGKSRSPEYAELKRRFGWEYDGMRMHELYFSNLGGNGVLPPSSSFKKLVEKSFGSFDAWKKDFIDTGMMRGIGWVVSYYDPEQDLLINAWINEHDVGHFAKNSPLLVMDVFEHAYITQFGLNRAQYIDTFFNNVDWTVVDERFD